MKSLSLKKSAHLWEKRVTSVVILGILSACSLLQIESGIQYDSLAQVVTRPAPEIQIHEVKFNWLDKYDPVLKYEEKIIPFEVYRFSAHEPFVTIELKSFFERASLGQSVFFPTIAILRANGQKLPLKNLYFYLEEETAMEKKHIHTKWQVALGMGGDFYLVVGADNFKSAEIHSGVGGSFEPVYYNFSQKVQTSQSGSYSFKLDLN